MLAGDSRMLTWERVQTPFDQTYYLVQLPADGALLVDGRSGCSAELRGNDVMPRRSWPTPIVGELPWGASGGAVAWSGGTEARAFLRRTDAADIEEWPLGGHAYVAHVLGNGRIVWPTINAGVRYWDPETAEGSQLVASPPVSGVRVVADGMEFDPLVVTAGPAFPRVRLGYTWHWATGTDSVQRRSVGPEGQCFSEATDRGRLARAYAHSDLVRVALSCSLVADIHVPHPLMVAWSGDDLLVTTAAGALLRVPGVAEQCA